MMKACWGKNQRKSDVSEDSVHVKHCYPDACDWQPEVRVVFEFETEDLKNLISEILKLVFHSENSKGGYLELISVKIEFVSEHPFPFDEIDIVRVFEIAPEIAQIRVLIFQKNLFAEIQLIHLQIFSLNLVLKAAHHVIVKHVVLSN